MGRAQRAEGIRSGTAAAVGVGTALLDLGLGILLTGGAAIDPLLFLSNGGRIVAGVLGGYLALRRSATDEAVGEPTGLAFTDHQDAGANHP